MDKITKETRVIDLTLGELINAISSNSPLESPVQKTPEDELGGIELAVHITKLAKQTIYGKVAARKIPYIKLPDSKKLYFSKKDLEEWLMSNKRLTERDTFQQASEYVFKRKALRS